MMAKNKMQMVDDDEIENVGIMAGFMDDMDGMLEEIIAEEMDGMDGENDEMARATGRSPDSPEILMNNLRGNMRSLDARREELADLVGYNAAAETPEEVLAMLQPVLAQQEAAGIASMMPPAQPPMPPEGMMPPMPEGMMPPMPPEGMMPPQGLASLAPPPMPMDQAPMQMAYGGMVQSFQEGSDPAGVTPIADAYSAYPQEVVEASIARMIALNNAKPRETTDLIQLTKQLQPQYQELLGVDPEAAKAQFLMGLGQSALRYAGNVSPEGEALSGSPMARLAGGFSDVPAKAAAASSLIQKQEQTAKLAALQGAQAQQSADVAYNTALMGQQLDIAKDIAKQKNTQPMTDAQKTDYNIPEDQLDLAWVIDQAGNASIAGGRPPVPLVDMGANRVASLGAESAGARIDTAYANAEKAIKDLAKIDNTIGLLENSTVDTGFGATFRQRLRQVSSLFVDGDNPTAAELETINALTDGQLLNAALGADVFGAISELGIGARGLDTPAEREFLREVVAGTIDMTKDTLLRMTALRRKATVGNIDKWNNMLADGRADQWIANTLGTIPSEPFVIPDVPVAANFDTGIGSSTDLTADVSRILSGSGEEGKN